MQTLWLRSKRIATTQAYSQDMLSLLCPNTDLNVQYSRNVFMPEHKDDIEMMKGRLRC